MTAAKLALASSPLPSQVQENIYRLLYPKTKRMGRLVSPEIATRLLKAKGIPVLPALTSKELKKRRQEEKEKMKVQDEPVEEIAAQLKEKTEKMVQER